MKPSDIWEQFKEKWVGTEEELEAALEHFYNDIRESVEKAMKDSVELGDAVIPETVLLTVDDYVGNHYF